MPEPHAKLPKAGPGIAGFDESVFGAIEVVTPMKDPLYAAGDRIPAMPVRRLPSPPKRIVGDLSNTGKVPVGLDIRPQGDAP